MTNTYTKLTLYVGQNGTLYEKHKNSDGIVKYCKYKGTKPNKNIVAKPKPTPKPKIKKQTGGWPWTPLPPCLPGESRFQRIKMTGGLGEPMCMNTILGTNGTFKPYKP